MDNNLVPHKENTTPDVKPHIPEELIYGILLRLPAKSLCRFRRVSTSFRAIIDMQLEDKINRKLIFEDWRPQPDGTTTFYVCSIDGGLEQKIVFRDMLCLSGGCNGLFLLSDRFSYFILWNPLTKQYGNPVALPSRRAADVLATSLGYDSACDKYKVVLIDAKNTWIFELRSNSWKKIDDEEFRPDNKHGGLDSACFAHGNLHWLHNPAKVFPYLNIDEQKIFAFDVVKEKFSLVTMPPVNPAGGHISDFCVVKERLCISYFHGAAGEVHLYLSNKDGEDYTWRKLCSMQLHLLAIEDFNIVGIVGYLEEGNKILLDVGLVEVFVEWKFMISYDLKGKDLSKVDFAVEEYSNGWKPRMFVPSFVPVGVESTSACKLLREEIYDEKERRVFILPLNE